MITITEVTRVLCNAGTILHPAMGRYNWLG